MAGTKDQILENKGFQQFTSTTAGLLTVPAGAKFAMLNVSGASGATVSIRDDGTAPTDTVGMILALGTNYWYTGKLKSLQAKCGATGTPALNISYYA